jgi:hypothetical protein
MKALVPEDIYGNGHRRRAINEMAMDSLVRACIVTANNKLNPGNPRNFAASRWGSEEARNVDAVIKAASAPASTSTAGWAKELSPVVQAFLANLVPLSAGADLLSRVLGLNFDGAGSISIPGSRTLSRKARPFPWSTVLPASKQR